MHERRSGAQYPEFQHINDRRRHRKRADRLYFRAVRERPACGGNGGEGGEGTGEGDSEEDGGSGENPLAAQIETEIVSAAPVQAGGGYTLHFSQYNGGRAEIRTAPDTEPVTGLFGKEPGKEQFEVLFGEEDYVCSPASYTDEEGERKIVLEVDLTEQYQALYPAAGITRAVRREYTSANAY